MEFKYLLIENNNGVATVTINNPKSLNALNYDIIHELDAAFAAIKVDESIDIVILTGAGRSFVAGADITYMQNMTALEGVEWAKNTMAVFRRIETLPQIVIAKINGFALGGGCELALSCDIRVASNKAKFGQPEVGLGITPGFGGTQRLPRAVGYGKAKELIFTSKMVDADEACKIGLVEEVYEAEELDAKVEELARTIQSKGKIAVELAKKAINIGMQIDIDSAMVVEQDIFGLCFATNDQEEGMTAFVEKRKPEFKNK